MCILYWDKGNNKSYSNNLHTKENAWLTLKEGGCWNEDNQRFDTSKSLNGTFRHQFQCTYRAAFKIEFSGTGGANDVIEDKIETKYS
jgi:hypothetical protein